VSASAIVCSWTGGNGLASAQSERSSREEVGERIAEGEFDDDCPLWRCLGLAKHLGLFG